MIKTSEQIDKIAPAIVKAQSAIEGVAHDKVNPFLKSGYASLGAIIREAKPILEKNGLAIIQMPVTTEQGAGINNIIVHDSGQYISETVTMETGSKKGQSDAQVLGSIISYLRRYSLGGILNIYTDEDVDGHAPETKTEKNPEPVKKQTNLNTIYENVVKSGLSENVHAAKNALKRCKTGYNTSDKAIHWMTIYRGFRDVGLDPKQSAEYADMAVRNGRKLDDIDFSKVKPIDQEDN